MNDINWDRVRYFTSREFDDPNHPGSGELINATLVLMLESVRYHSSWPMIIHWQAGGRWMWMAAMAIAMIAII